MSFVHLHLHSQYSLLEATCTAKKLCKKAVEYNMPAMALTDNGNMFGALEFYFAAKSAGVKPIIGLDAYLAPKSRLIKGEDKDAVRLPNRRLVLLAQNFAGYQNLCKISSIGYQEGFYYKPRIDMEVLKEFNSNIIVLSGGIKGEIPYTFLEHGPDAALEKIRELNALFPERFYLELNRTGLPQWNEINRFLLEASQITGVPVVAANDVHYMTQDEQLAQEVLICIGTNKTLQDEYRYRLGSDQFFLKSPEQMRSLFADIPIACDNTLQIAERCNVDFKLKDAQGKAIYHLPSFPVSEGRSLADEIREIAYKGLELRFKEAKDRNEEVAESDKPKYHERLDFELNVIDGMGFNGYFLIVQDFINWAKEHEIPVGPGRGSGAGSLVAYCLRITDLDPVPHSLIFERFLNPERISMPDFDIDFCQDRRQEVIEYVTQKYGQQSVSQIITYGKLQARAAIRDVGRVLGMTYADVDVISKLMPDKLGLTLKEAIEMEPRLQEKIENDPQVATLMDLSQKIEGLVRHAGIHAAGVIIADGNLVAHAPLYKGAAGENVVQYDMKHSEKIGLIKFDFLGLKTLTHIQYALNLIKKNRGKKITTSDISIEDPGIYEIMSKGDTAGIFQFEGEGITDAIRKIKPTCFADITAINALYRPGPMDMIPEYTARKHGKKPVEYIFPELESILKETYGIIIYQEHVQLIAAKIAKYSLGEADMLRRAMGKKIPEEMAQHRERFLRGAIESGFDRDKANELFNLMEEFANYGFNKSHAAAYCVIAGQTAWLKHYYPVEFFAALLSTEMSDTDKVVKYVKDAQKRGILVRPPNVNFSEHKFTVNQDEIFFGLGAVKGVGESAVEAIIEARASLPEQKFTSLEHFFDVVDLRRVNKKVIECLIKAGAFDSFSFNRAQLFNGYIRYLERAEINKKDRDRGQVSLFEIIESAPENMVVLEACRPWTRTQQLSFEKDVLGFYLSDHPLNGLDRLAKAWATTTVEGLSQIESKKMVIIVGLVTTLKEVITKKGTRMAFCNFEDLTGRVELIAFPDVYAEFESILKSENPILLTAQLEKDGEAVKLLLDTCKPFVDSLAQAKKMILRLTPHMQGKMQEIGEVLKQAPGTTRLNLQVDVDNVNKQVMLEVQEPQGVRVSQSLIESLYEITGTTENLTLH